MRKLFCGSKGKFNDFCGALCPLLSSNGRSMRNWQVTWSDLLNRVSASNKNPYIYVAIAEKRHCSSSEKWNHVAVIELLITEGGMPTNSDSFAWSWWSCSRCWFTLQLSESGQRGHANLVLSVTRHQWRSRFLRCLANPTVSMVFVR